MRTSPVKRIISDTLADGAPSSTAIKKVRQCNSAYKEQDVYNYISLHINSDNRRLTPWQSTSISKPLSTVIVT